jgi:hypothetical protein
VTPVRCNHAGTVREFVSIAPRMTRWCLDACPDTTTICALATFGREVPSTTNQPRRSDHCQPLRTWRTERTPQHAAHHSAELRFDDIAAFHRMLASLIRWPRRARRAARIMMNVGPRHQTANGDCRRESQTCLVQARERHAAVARASKWQRTRRREGGREGGREKHSITPALSCR